jgi:hypothetical protein
VGLRSIRALPNPTPTPGANSLTWEKFFDGAQHLADFDPHVAVDAQGNTYVAATSGSFTSGDTDITTIKYGPEGRQLWVATFAGPGDYKDWANDIKIDSAGNELWARRRSTQQIGDDAFCLAVDSSNTSTSRARPTP